MEQKKKSNNTLGYLLAGAIGLAAGFFATKALTSKDEEKEEGIYEHIQFQERPRDQDNNNNNVSYTSSTNSVETLEGCEDLFCPITLEIMERPMISRKCGHSFENKAISQWLQSKDYCPKCHTPLQQQDLIENYSLKNTIQYLKAQGEAMKKKDDLKSE